MAAAALVAVACAGCGLGSAPGAHRVGLRVTEDFGARLVSATSVARLRGSPTLLGLLRRSFAVGTGRGGREVTSIGGRAGDWSVSVNGIAVTRAPGAVAVHPGDQIWWDMHAAGSVRAVVGAFPEPFLHGFGGKRYPVTVECAGGVSAACHRVTAALGAARVPVSSQFIGTGSGPDTLGVVVGTWSELGSQLAGALIAHGPGASGVYARFAGARGGTLQLLDPDGRVVRTLGAGTGLVAATADSASVPTWLITGTDAAGVRAAAAALAPGALHDHYALAVRGADRIPVPLRPRS